MQNTAGRDGQSDDRNDNSFSVVSNLVSLVDHIRASMKALELAIARELPSLDEETHDNVVVLDDITPCYVKANAALHACEAALGVALNCLLDTKASGCEAGGLAGNSRSGGLANCA